MTTNTTSNSPQQAETAATATTGRNPSSSSTRDSLRGTSLYPDLVECTEDSSSGGGGTVSLDDVGVITDPAIGLISDSEGGKDLSFSKNRDPSKGQALLGAHQKVGGDQNAARKKEELNDDRMSTNQSSTGSTDPAAAAAAAANTLSPPTATTATTLVNAAEHNHGIMPLPMMERGMTRRPNSRITPGAHREGHDIDQDYDEEALNMDGRHPHPQATPPRGTPRQTNLLAPHATNNNNNNSSNSDLAVANLVHDSADLEQQQGLPQAENFDATTAAQRRKANEAKWFKTRLGMAAILLIASLVLVVSLVVVKSKENANDDNNNMMSTTNDGPPSNSPTLAPTSFEESILSLFPEETVQAILFGDDSNTTTTNTTAMEEEEVESSPTPPQVRAYQWLMEEKEYFPFLPTYRIQQRYALATFYFSTNGDTTWHNKTNWLHHSIHECLWFSGMDTWYWKDYEPLYPLEYANPCELPQDPTTFVSDGVFRHLWLPQNGVSGDWAPSELFQLLPELKSIALYWGYDFDARSIPGPQIANLQQLELLAMYASYLTGPIPSEFGQMTNLKIVEIAINALTGSIPTELYSMSQLESFVAVGSLLSGQFPTELGMLTNAKRMGVAHTLLTGTIPTQLGNLAAVEMMLLRTMTMVTGTIPSQIARLDNMWLFEVEASSLTGTIPSWFGDLKSLRWLTLNKNSFTGTIPSELGLMTNGAGFPGIFTLDDNHLTGTIPTELSNLDHMITFTLYGNNLTGPLPSQLGMLAAVTEFRLEDNDLTGAIPSQLGRLSNAATIKLNGNLLTGLVPLELQDLARNGSIQSLHVQDNDLIGIIPPDLCDVENLAFDCSDRLCGCDWCNCSFY